MSNRWAIGKRHLLIGVATLSLGGAALSVFLAVTSSETYEIWAGQTIDLVRSPSARPVETQLNTYANKLFAQSGKQDRADYTTRITAELEPERGVEDTAADRSASGGNVPIIAASFIPVDMARPGPTRFAGAAFGQDVNRDGKADRLAFVPGVVKKAPPPKSSDESLNGPGMSAAVFMMSSTPGNFGIHKDGATTTAFEESAETDVQSVESKPSGKSSWSDLIKLARVTGGDGEKIKEGIFGNLTEKEFRAREFRCMSTAIYFEARGESIKGQTAVAQVIMTRVRSDYYPNTICGVVYQGQWNRNACQFSFACDGRTDKPKDKKQWNTAIDVAKKVISGQAYIKEIGGATHYHATYVSPDWRKQMNRLTRIGIHIFYKAPFVRPLVASTELNQL